MGKVHQIKKAFRRVTSQKPLQPGTYRLRYLGPYLYIGKRFDGSMYLAYYGDRYKPLMKKLIREYEGGRSS